MNLSFAYLEVTFRQRAGKDRQGHTFSFRKRQVSIPHDLWETTERADMTPIHDDEARLANLEEVAEDIRQATQGAPHPPEFSDELIHALLRHRSPYATLPLSYLEKCGVELRPPEALDDEELSRELWRAIHHLALIGFLLRHTDHLSDRQLYHEIYHDYLRDPTAFDLGITEPRNYVHDLAMEDLLDYLIYYTDDLSDEEREARWNEPEPLPARRPKPYDRDRFLP